MKFLLSTLTFCTICIITLIADESQKDSEIIVDTTIEATNEEAMLEMLGYLTVYRDGLKDLGFGIKEADAIARGLKKALADEVMDPVYQERMGEFQAFIEKKIKETQSIREESQVAQLEENINRGKDFIDGLAMDESVKSTASGLHKILKKENLSMQKLLIQFVFIIKAHELMAPSLIVHINEASPQIFLCRGLCQVLPKA